MWHVVTLQLIGVGRVPMDTGSQLFEKGSIRWIQKWVLPTSEKSGMPRWHWSSVEASPLPKTNSKFAPENRPKLPQKEAGSSSNHPFCAMWVSGRVNHQILGINLHTPPVATNSQLLGRPFDPLFVRRCTQLSQKRFTLQLFQAMLLEFSGQRTTKPVFTGWLLGILKNGLLVGCGPLTVTVGNAGL